MKTFIEIRLEPWQKAAMQKEAARFGLNLSAWIRSICLRQCVLGDQKLSLTTENAKPAS